ncbi:hypothetical protein Tco_0781646 [Tanacetum coccineum]
MIISQRRGINPRNPQHVTKNYETCGSNVHTTSDHNDIEWFRKRETPHDKKAESSITLRSKTPTKRLKAIRISLAFAINNPQSFEKQWNPPPSLSQENKPEREQLVSSPTELKDLPSKFNELTKEIKGLKRQVHELEIELPKELKEIPTKLEDFTKTATTKVESAQGKLKTLDALPSLLLNVTKAVNKFVEVLESTPTKAGDQSVPIYKQANTMPTEGEKDTNQATISQLFQRRAEKIAEAEKENLNQ